MTTINRHQLASILKYLDQAAAEAAKENKFSTESNCQWTIRMAKERLLNAILTDVEIEPVPAERVHRMIDEMERMK